MTWWPATTPDSPGDSVNSPSDPYALDAMNPKAITATPIWAIMPPPVRPNSPRQPLRRTPSHSSRAALPMTKPPMPSASTCHSPCAPAHTDSTMVSAPAAAGHTSRFERSSAGVSRQFSAGDSAIRPSNAMPTGASIRSKYGRPTARRSDATASARSGNTVPSITTNAATAKSRLFPRNDPSRDQIDRRLAGFRSASPRHATSTTPLTTITAKNASRIGPSDDSLNSCTDSSTPERVRNVPKMVNANVMMSSERFHTRSI